MTSVSAARAELLWLPPDEIRPNRWNPNVMDPEMLAKARASIAEFGFVDPITARAVPDDLIPYHEIIDGEHRWQIAIEEKIDSIPVMSLGELSDSVAQQLTIVLNETRGQADPEKLGKLLRELMAKETKNHLLSTLPYTREALDRLTGLPSMTWEALDRPARPQVPTGRLSTWVERTYRMPKEAADVIDQAIARVRESEGDTNDWQAIEYIAADFLGK
jgi:hypothetical protein